MQSDMKIPFAIVLMFIFALSGCIGNNQNTGSSARQNTTVSATPIPTPVMPKNGDYPGKGKVTKINLELVSVELDHEDIPGVMPPMRMEFFVTDKKQIESLKVSDNVDFTLRYKDHAETIVDIRKAQ